MAEFKYQQLTQEQQDKLDAAAFRRLLAHLDVNKEVQNIDLMILAVFAATVLVSGTWQKRRRWNWISVSMMPEKGCMA